MDPGYLPRVPEVPGSLQHALPPIEGGTDRQPDV